VNHERPSQPSAQPAPPGGQPRSGGRVSPERPSPGKADGPERTPARLADLEERIDDAALIDQRDLRSRAATIRERARKGEAIDKPWDEFERRLKESCRERQLRREAKPRVKLNQSLPVTERAADIAEAISKHQVVVICGETGSGKTTQIPQICLELGRGQAGLIGHTQPRRLAARSVAARVAEELGVSLGQQVGYKVRFGDETSDRTMVKLMTDGILLAETQGDRLLEQYDTIIVDEAHERSLNIDFLLGYLRNLLPRRPDLKIIITSATIDPERFSRHFDGAPIIMVSGRTFPVEMRYRPVNPGGWESEEPPDQRDMDDAIVAACDELTSRSRGDTGRGDILVFLSGEREIRDAADALREFWGDRAEILPLFARLTNEEQQRIFKPGGKRRIVLSTNVAETSLTVPGIKYVVDTGVARMSRYSPRTKVQRLPIEPVSRASANQRSGRCGRVEPGVCIRLYEEADFNSRPEFTEPEILRTNLASVILQMKALHLGRVEDFPFIERPDDRLIKDGYETLHELGAMAESGELTEIGRRLARLPIDPRLGRMLLAAEHEHCLPDMLVLCSALSIQDPRERPQSAQDAADQAHKRHQDPESDFLSYIRLWEYIREQTKDLGSGRARAWCRDNYISVVRLREWREVHAQLRELCEEIGLDSSTAPRDAKPGQKVPADAPAAPIVHATNRPPAESDAERRQQRRSDSIHRALLAGLLSNIGMKTDGFDYHGCRGSKFLIFPGSVLFKKGPKWMMAAEIVQTTKLYARTGAKITPEWAEEIGQHVIKKSYSDPHWQEDQGQVCAFERVTLFGLTLVPRRRAHYGHVNPAQSREIFIDQGLMEGRISKRLAFLEHNQAVIKQVKGMEAKVRRQDILAEHKQIYAFYDKRLPPEVCSVGTLERWLHKAEKQDPRVLRMTLADVLDGDGEAITEDLYPELIEIKGQIIECRYRLDPQREDDGLTLIAPLEALPALDEQRVEWLIPGWLEDRVHLLLRALPKSIRTQIDPVIDLAREATAALRPRFGQGSLLDALAAEVQRLRGVEIPRNAWNWNGLPKHYRGTIEITGDDGKVLAESKDVAELNQRLAGRLRKHLASIAAKTFARTGITRWDFGPLPSAATAPPGTPGAPALVDRGDSVSITLEAIPTVAEAKTRLGVRRLFELTARAELDARLRGQKNWHRLTVLHASTASSESLLDSMRLWLAERVFMTGKNLPQNAEEFDARVNERWGKLGQTAGELAQLAEVFLETRHRLGLKLDQEPGADWADLHQDLAGQIKLLTSPGFIAEIGDERLGHLPRYLEAAITRLHKLRNGNERRDRRNYNALLPLWRRYLIALDIFLKDGQGKQLEPGFTQHRWLLEELRVSLFAERLGTFEPVSAKRLNDHWATLGLD
jgi:ATP-dependent helicase HrpA